MFLARPEPSSAEYSKFGGAFVNAWVAHTDEAIAEQIARDAIEGRGMRVERLEDYELVTRENYRDLPKSLEYFEQAVFDGHCLVFHLWPPEGEDLDEGSPA